MTYSVYFSQVMGNYYIHHVYVYTYVTTVGPPNSERSFPVQDIVNYIMEPLLSGHYT